MARLVAFSVWFGSRSSTSVVDGAGRSALCHAAFLLANDLPGYSTVPRLNSGLCGVKRYSISAPPVLNHLNSHFRVLNMLSERFHKEEYA